MSIYKPYTYLIGWSKYNIWYYGARWAKKCDPCDLWTTYFTSSKEVKKYRELYGEPDVVEVRKTFTIREEARIWEEKVQRRLNVIKDDKWLNKQYGGKKFCSDGDPETSKKISKSLKGKSKSEEHKQALRKPKKKGYKQTLDHKYKRSMSNSCEWYITFPDGHKEIIKNLSEFCRQEGLKYGQSNLIHGWSYKGYKAKKYG